MPQHADTFLLELFAIFVWAKVFAEIFERLSLPAVLGELLAGVILGPHAAGLIAPSDTVGSIAEIGAIFLLFTVGLETRPQDLIRVGRQSIRVAIAGVAFPFGRIHAWDVVNEAVTADGQLRKSKWLEIIGEDYLLKAFEYARQADPGAQLYYNDYDNEKPPQTAGVVRLIRNLQSHGVRVDGVGIQGHWFLDCPRIEEIENAMLALSQLGVKLMITELDVSVLPYYPVDSKATDLSAFDPEAQKQHNPYSEAVPASVQSALANRYAELFSLFRKHRGKLSRVTFWAVHDGQSWRNYLPIRGRTDHPMLFDRLCRPKPAFDAVVGAVRGVR